MNLCISRYLSVTSVVLYNPVELCAALCLFADGGWSVVVVQSMWAKDHSALLEEDESDGCRSLFRSSLHSFMRPVTGPSVEHDLSNRKFRNGKLVHSTSTHTSSAAPSCTPLSPWWLRPLMAQGALANYTARLAIGSLGAHSNKSWSIVTQGIFELREIN